jgi:hypothetical protein
MNTYKTKLLQNIEAMKEKLASMEDELNKLEKIKHFPSKDDLYFYYTPMGTVCNNIATNDNLKINVFKSEEEAKKAYNKAVAVEKIKRRIKELQGDWKPNWLDDGEEKFCIMHDHIKKLFITDCWYITEHYQLLPYMENKTIAATIMNEMEDELKLILL